jgi:Rod binding domain-containing protein
MDDTKLILTDPVASPTLLGQLDKFKSVSEEKREELARDFESVFIHKLLEEMKDTIGDWGFEKEGDSEQVQGIFWLYLARDIANNGGFGLWKDVYQFFSDLGEQNTGVQLDRNI